MNDELNTKARYACRRSTLAILGAVAPGWVSGGQIRMRIWSRWRFALGVVLAELVNEQTILRQPFHTGYRYRLHLRPHGERWCHRCRVRPPIGGGRYCGDCRQVLAWSPATLHPDPQHNRRTENDR